MTELKLDERLVGQRVCNPARPEWGVGTVLRVQRVQGAAGHVFRVGVQFPVGHKQLVVPPARLAPPQAEIVRESGWLETLGKRSVDDRLRRVPDDVTQVLGGPAARAAAYFPLYAYDDSPEELLRWARRQAGVGDPLTLWSRDELQQAWRAFEMERDAGFRGAAAQLAMKSGREAVQALLDQAPAELRERLLAALRKVI